MFLSVGREWEFEGKKREGVRYKGERGEGGEGKIRRGNKKRERERSRVRERKTSRDFVVLEKFKEN